MNIQETNEIKEIWYNNGMKPFPVYKIPLDSLIYNKYNGRIKSLVKSYESGIGRDLDAKNEIDKKIIESYLFDSAENRNEKTLQSLNDYGQQEIGIVTNDFIIIDGNRRALLLNKLHRNGNPVNYFKAIKLPDNLLENKIEIIKLETNYQMGVDNKVEYKPIEKYLRCQELIEYNVSINEVAKLMSESPNRIQQWLDILKLMESYLIYLGSNNVYTRLDKKEGHFVDLYNYLKKYDASNWNINQLKDVYFDFIRLGISVQRARVIGNPKNGLSLFAKKELWTTFYLKHSEVKNNYKEPSFIEIKSQNTEKSNEEIFEKLDSDFQLSLTNDLNDNLTDGEIKIKQLTERHSALKELNRIIDSLKNINLAEIIFEDKERVKKLLDLISEQAINNRNSL